MAVRIPSPAIAIVGRHNSGKTTLIEKLIAELTARGLDVGSVKHHSHVGFDIDIPGKDSYRHRAAGATETVIAAPGQMAVIKDVDGELECADIVADMPGHDIVVVEGYRKSGLPTIEIMRAGNPVDMQVASVFDQASIAGVSMGEDFVQAARTRAVGNQDEAALAQVEPEYRDISNKMPSASTVAVVTDIPLARGAAMRYGIPAFDLDDVAGLADFLQQRFARVPLTVAIQAGGESRRMGTDKAQVPFAGRPLIHRLIDRLAPVADHIIITTNNPSDLEFVHSDYPDLDITLVPDVCEERGALRGMYTAFKEAKTPYVAIVACDMIFASARLIAAEAIELGASQADAVVPVNKHGFEPFHALYRRKTCLAAVEQAIEQGKVRAQDLFSLVKVDEFPQARVLQVEPMGGCFVNANTPEELATIERAFAEE